MGLDELPLWGDITVTSILSSALVWVLWAIITGRLVPRSTLNDQKDNANTYKAAWETERARTAQQDDLIERLKIVGENMDRVLNSLPHPEKGREDDKT